MRFLIALAVIAVASANTLHPYANLWKSWKANYAKTYTSEVEDEMRFRTFLDNAAKVAKHNLEYELGMHTFTTGLNHLADLTEDEFRATLLTVPRTPSLDNSHEINSVVGSTPSSIDWREYGYVTDVKDQGSCGSCWSFGSTGALEGQFVQKNGTLLSFSEQQQVDCNTLCYGCNGGNAELAFHYWKKVNGPNLESDYPYTGVDGTCHTSDYQVIGDVTGYVSVTKYSESALETAVGSVGPVTIAIDASKWSFQLYTSGIYYSSTCSQYSLDHQVLAVGYGSDSDGDYWIVKNSWGTSWGLDGYIWMSRNRNNNCGIASDGSYPTLG